jgi:hypothetical protein
MKNIAFMTLILLFCLGLIQFAGALQPDKHINHTQFSRLKYENKREEVFPYNFSKKELSGRSEGRFFMVRKKNSSKKHFFDIFKKIEKRKGKNKINETSLATHKNLSIKKTPLKIKLETNKFEDKNGDGINDIVANPKL